MQPGYSGSLRHEQLSLDDLLDQCSFVFGKEIATPDCHSERTNKNFGGATPTGSKIIYLDYSDDPWNRASVQGPLGSEMPYCMTTCDGCGHCGAGVPKNLTHCSDMEAAYVDKWISEARGSLSEIEPV